MTRHSTMRAWARRAGAGISLGATAALLAACSPGGGGALGEGDGTGLVIPTNESPWLAAYQELIAMYEEETGVDVELRTMPLEELRPQLINDIQTGSQTYDIYQIDEPQLAEYFANEWVQPLNEIDPDFVPDEHVYSYSDVAYWNPETKQSDASGDLMIQPLNANVGLFIYRTDVYSSLGLDVPATWEDAVANGRAAMDAGKIRYGYVTRGQAAAGSGTQVTYDFLPLFYGYGASWFADEGTDWTPTANSPEAIQAATVFRELAKLGPAETNTIGQAQAIGAMQAGEALQTHLVSAAAPQMLNENDSNIVDTVGFSVLPAGPTGQPAGPSGVWGLAVPAGLSEERSRAALDFIKWVETKEAQTRFAEAGGIPTRDDVVESADLTDQQLSYLSLLDDALEFVQPNMRYEFSGEMLPMTEGHLAAIVAGAVSPEDGMNQIQTDLTALVEKYGYPMAGSQ